jgi:hypothetical protein
MPYLWVQRRSSVRIADIEIRVEASGTRFSSETEIRGSEAHMSISRMCWCRDQVCRLQSVTQMLEQRECPTPGPLHRSELGYDKHAKHPRMKWRGRLFVTVPRELRPSSTTQTVVSE